MAAFTSEGPEVLENCRSASRQVFTTGSAPWSRWTPPSGRSWPSLNSFAVTWMSASTTGLARIFLFA
ncbi:hypothetical protein ABT009_40475 [Streptomyces sp. NPDC002896]|uniref:hypothetical protein n=1 Tax=Streptomyces sp. NPDC002896 TaxID=3154438 RepID=UPI003316777A